MLTFPNVIPAFSEQVKIDVVPIDVVSGKSLGETSKKHQYPILAQQE